MQIAEITIHPIDEDLVKAYVSCFMVREIRVMQGLTGLLVSFPAKKQSNDSDRQLTYPANAERRNLFQRVILAEYENLVGEEDSVPSVRSASERLRALDQLRAIALATYRHLDSILLDAGRLLGNKDASRTKPLEDDLTAQHEPYVGRERDRQGPPS